MFSCPPQKMHNDAIFQTAIPRNLAGMFLHYSVYHLSHVVQRDRSLLLGDGSIEESFCPGFMPLIYKCSIKETVFAVKLRVCMYEWKRENSTWESNNSFTVLKWIDKRREGLLPLMSTVACCTNEQIQGLWGVHSYDTLLQMAACSVRALERGLTLRELPYMMSTWFW